MLQTIYLDQVIHVVLGADKFMMGNFSALFLSLEKQMETLRPKSDMPDMSSTCSDQPAIPRASSQKATAKSRIFPLMFSLLCSPAPNEQTEQRPRHP